MNLKRYVYIAFLFIVYTLPISIINKPYRDDYDRIINNYMGWSDNGRPLSDLVVGSIISGGPMISFGLFSCVLSSLIIALTFVIYSRYVREDYQLKSLLPLFVFYLSPLFIQFLYYKFDSITILLSIAIVFVPFIFSKHHNRLIFNIVTIVCVMLSLSLYQASFPVFLALLAIRSQSDDFNLRETCISVFSCMLGVLIYKVFISGYFISGVYSEDSSRLLSPLEDGFIDKYIENAQKVWGMVKLIDSYTVAVSLSIAVALVLIWMLMNIKKQTSRMIKLIISASSAIGVSLLFLLQYNVATEPRSLIYVSSIIFLFLALASTLVSRKVTAVICSVIIAVFINIYIHVNYARDEQFRYEQSVMQMINNVADRYPDKKIYIYGWSAPKRVVSVYDSTPLSIKIANPDFGSWYFTQYLDYYNARRNIFRGGSTNFNISCNEMMVEYNGFYTIGKHGNNIAIYLRDIKCS